MNHHAVCHEGGSGEEGETGAELVLLLTAAVPADAAQGHAEQAGGEFDAFGITTDPE